MRVMVTSIPKSGTHAAVRACTLLGVPCFYSHRVFEKPQLDKNFHIYRHPRNVLVSYVRRLNDDKVPQGFLINYMKDFHSHKSLVDYAMQFTGWLDNESTYAFKFEDLIASDKVMRKMAAFVDVPFLDDAFPSLLGNTHTWTGHLSDWRDHWTDQVDNVWTGLGGAELEQAFNYGSV